MKFTDILIAFPFGRATGACVAENSVQGRTLYGDMPAALCLEGALLAFKDLPPLRLALISFIGPAEGEFAVNVGILGRGRSVTFVNGDLHCEAGIAARGVFAFGGARQSMFDVQLTPLPDLAGPDDAMLFFPPDQGLGFSRNFDAWLAKGGLPISSSKEFDHFLWVRHRDANATSVSALLALADIPPPAIMPMFPRSAPIISMTLSLNFLTDQPVTDDGWRLMESRAEYAVDGYSSQDMFVWSRRGDLVIAGRQPVAIFI